MYPGLFGLLIYACVRLITDSASRYNVLLERKWWINAIEIVTVVAVGYLTFRMLDWYEEKHKGGAFKSWKQVFKEFAGLAFWNMLLMNATVGVMTATTDDGMDFHDFVIVNTIPLLFVLVVYSVRRGNYFLRSYIDSKVKLERIQKDKADTELALLKSQYHPHFLFNSLNTIYFQMDENIGEAKRTIEKLSDLLRYQLYEEKENRVSLAKELDHIGSYIDLQKVRHGSALELDMNLDAGIMNKKVYPLLFMPLVENAFKYVGGGKQIRIKVTDLGDAGENTLEFCVSNSLEPKAALVNNTQPNRGGLGLLNLRKRLELLYPGRFELNTAQHEQHFEARLKLSLDEN